MAGHSRILSALASCVLAFGMFACGSADQFMDDGPAVDNDGSPTQDTGQPTTAPVVAEQLPALSGLPSGSGSQLRTTSDAGYDLLDDPPVLTSGNGSANYAAGILELDPALNSGFAWAIFELFDFNNDALVRPLNVSATADQEVWLCVSDYGSGAWAWFRSPFDFPFVLDAGHDWTSPSGSLYVAVITVKATTQVDALLVTTNTNLPSDGYQEREHNDSFSSANAFPALPFTGFSGNVGAGGYDGDTADYFSFSAVEMQQVEIFVTYDAGQGNLELALLSPASEAVLADDSAGNPGTRQISLGLKTGVHTLRVTAASGSSDYSIDCSTAFPAYDEAEDNDTLLTGNPLSTESSSVYTGHIGAGGYDGDNDDYFVLTAAKGESVTAELSYTEATGNVALELVSEIGEVLNRNDLANPGSRSVTAGLHEGTNLVHVEATSGGSPYTLTVTRTPTSYDETEDNDSFAAGNPLPAVPVVGWSGSVGASGYDGDNADYFKLPTADGDIVTLTLTYTAATGNAGLRFSNPDESSANFDFSGNPGTRSFIWGAHGGNSYVSVEQLAGVTDYSLDVSISNPGYDELEDNDTFLTANALPALPVVGWTGSLGPNGYDGDSADYYSFSTNDGDLVSLTLNYLPGEGDAALSFAQPDQSLVYTDETGNPGIRSFVWGARGGTCFVIVEHRSGKVNYSLEVSSSQPGYDELENNDTLNSAQALPALPVVAFFGSIGPFSYDGDGSDYYSFTAAEGEQFTFDLSYDETFGNVFIALQKASGQQIYADQSGNPGVRGFEWGLRAGSYRLKISGDSTGGNYLLGVSSSFPGYGEEEDNDSLDQAYEPHVPFAGLIGHVGQFGYDGDTLDYLLYNADPGDQVTFDLTYDSLSGTLQMFLLDSSGATIDEDSADNPGTRTVSATLTGGSYYVLVGASSGFSQYSMDGSVISP